MFTNFEIVARLLFLKSDRLEENDLDKMSCCMLLGFVRTTNICLQTCSEAVYETICSIFWEWHTVATYWQNGFCTWFHKRDLIA